MSGHGHPEVFEGVIAGCSFGGIFVLLRECRNLFEDIFQASEENLKYGYKLATVEEVDFRYSFGFEDTWKEANTHIVHGHFVDILLTNDLGFEEE